MVGNAGPAAAMHDVVIRELVSVLQHLQFARRDPLVILFLGETVGLAALYAEVNSIGAAFGDDKFSNGCIVLGDDVERVHNGFRILTQAFHDKIITVSKTNGGERCKYVIENAALIADLIEVLGAENVVVK